MKKILLSVISLFMLLTINVKATEIKEIGNKKYTINEIVYMCDGEKYYLEEYLPIPNKAIITNGEVEKIYKDGVCSDLSIQDKLDIENRTEVYSFYDGDFDKTTLKYSDVYYGFSEGYVLNTEEYNENEIYYTYTLYESEEDGSYDQTYGEDLDKSKLNEYYVVRYFKHIDSPKLEENKKYYVETRSEMFELFTGEVKEEEEYLEIYEMISKDDAFQNEKTYVLTEEQRQNVIDKNNIDLDKQIISEYVIGNDVYYMVTTEDENNNILSISYYDKDGNEVFKDYKNKFIDTNDNYIVIYNLNLTEFEIYDNEYNFITKYNFESETFYDLVENDEDIYILFEDDNHTTYLIDSEIVINYGYYFAIIGGIIILIIGYYFFNKYRK